MGSILIKQLNVNSFYTTAKYQQNLSSKYTVYFITFKPCKQNPYISRQNIKIIPSNFL